MTDVELEKFFNKHEETVTELRNAIMEGDGYKENTELTYLLTKAYEDGYDRGAKDEREYWNP